MGKAAARLGAFGNVGLKAVCQAWEERRSWPMKMLGELSTFRLSSIQSGFPAVARQNRLHAVVVAV